MVLYGCLLALRLWFMYCFKHRGSIAGMPSVHRIWVVTILITLQFAVGIDYGKNKDLGLGLG